ncbi:hypothetical protein K457DRAFT_25199 [Linnemannia elongata AG-77]|uniref:Uncharacterized protein n=1 Tax=Linnemannia elongata AG-77 TaxID=1314771 RepID=A0A197JFQ9_9FUNG|nr:hypothetical protein K457DRAFT_25199 [Linnemannia elongata AG-77]
MPATDSIPMSSEVARSGTPPPRPTVDVENDTDNDSQDGDHGQNDTGYIQTTTQQDNHRFREQDQSRLDSEADDDNVGVEDDYENEDDPDWCDDNDDNDDEDGYFEEEPDPVYVADLLRQSGIDWMQYPDYATHRLVVTSNSTTAEDAARETEGQQVPGRQYYRVMAQFLIPGSAVFRDFLLGEEEEEEEEEDGDEQEQEFRKERLACLQDGPFTDNSDPSLADNTYFQDSTPNAPKIAHSLLEPLEPFIYQRYAPYTPITSSSSTEADNTDPYAHQPWIHLSLLHPEHFPGLLKAMYTMDLDTWEETCFRPETIVGIIETVRRLECCSRLMVKCLDYFRKVEDILGVEEFEKDWEGGLLEEVRRLVRATVECGMLTPDPDL